jgi:hypothetical protein
MSFVGEPAVVILGFSGDLEIISGFLSAVSHWHFVEGILQTVITDSIVQLLMTESSSFSRLTLIKFLH